MKPRHIYVVFIDFGYEGNGEPEISFSSQEDAEKYCKEHNVNCRYYEYRFVEVALL